MLPVMKVSRANRRKTVCINTVELCMLGSPNKSHLHIYLILSSTVFTVISSFIFDDQILYTPLSVPIRATCCALAIPRDLLTSEMFGADIRRSSLSKCFPPHVCCPLLGPKHPPQQLSHTLSLYSSLNARDQLHTYTKQQAKLHK